MNLTPDQIINVVCRALELDRDKLLTEKAQRNRDYALKYTDAGHIAVYLIRAKVLVPRVTKKYGREMKPPTYKNIAYEFKRKSHEAIIRWELECRIKLRDKNPEFKAKYDMVVNLLDNNINVA